MCAEPMLAQTSPEPLAITCSAAALLVSDIPFQKAVAGVRVGILSRDPKIILRIKCLQVLGTDSPIIKYVVVLTLVSTGA